MKDKTYYLLFIIGLILLILGIIITLILIFQKEENSKEKEYDCYTFSIVFPPSLCYNIENKSEQEKCFGNINNTRKEEDFVINGLWPNYTSGDNIDECNKGDEVNVTFKKGYENTLNNNWPILLNSEKDKWNNEYNRYGYCYIQRIEKDPKEDYKLYFDKANYIYQSYHQLMKNILYFANKGLLNVTKAKFKGLLSESSIPIDSSTYSLMCEFNGTTETNVLSEIRINYDLDFTKTSDVKSTENCPDNFQIYFSKGRKVPFYEEYEYYLMSLAWLPTYCKGIGEECYNKLKETDLNIMFLNGLWPALKRGYYFDMPKWCNMDEDIQVEVEELPNDLYNNMTKYWISANSEDKVLWTRDYNMHGYCFSQRHNYSSDNYTYYFQTAMNIFINNNLTELLKEIFPGNVSGVQEVERTTLDEYLKNKFGAGTFSLNCINYDGEYYLSQIILHFNFTYDVTKYINSIDNCSTEIYIEFIDYESPQEQDKDLYKYYDMYYFTILWLPTSCLDKGEECKERIKKLPKNQFTVHGLWPSYQNGSETHWCNVDNDIKIEIKDEELLDFMNKYYPGSYLSNEFIWGYEYNMHGYCYNQRNGFETNEYEFYFNKIKELYEQFNLNNMLMELYGENIKGDKEINRNEIQDYLENKKFNKDTYLLVCTNITYKNNSVYTYLLEIRIRLDLNFEKIGNETDVSEFDCPEKFYVFFLDKSDYNY